MSVGKLVILLLLGGSIANMAVGAEEPILNDDCVPTVDAKASIRGLIAALEKGEVESIEVLYISTNKFFRQSVSSDFIRKNYDSKLVQRGIRGSRNIDRFVNALEETRIKTSDMPGDMRWAFRFFSNDGKTVFELYLDKFGRRGILNGGCITTDNNAVLRWAIDTFAGAFE